MLVLNTYLGDQFPAQGAAAASPDRPRAYNGLLTRPRAAPTTPPRSLCRTRLARAPRDLQQLLQRPVLVGQDAPRPALRRRTGHPPRATSSEYIHGKPAQFDGAFHEARIPLHKDLPYYFGALIKRISKWLGLPPVQRRRNSRPLLDAIYASPRARAARLHRARLLRSLRRARFPASRAVGP